MISRVVPDGFSGNILLVVPIVVYQTSTFENAVNDVKVEANFDISDTESCMSSKINKDKTRQKPIGLGSNKRLIKFSMFSIE